MATNKPIFVLIGIPSLQTVDVNFAVSLAGMAASSAARRIGFTIQPMVSFTIPNAHNALVTHMTAAQATHLLLVETDNTFPHDTLARLLEHDKAIVGATYLTRSPPHVYMGNELEGGPIDVWKGRCRRVASLPTGCVLIRADVFVALGRQNRPLWETPWNPEKGAFDTDDYHFFDRARGADIDVFCDVELSRAVGHLSAQRVLVATDRASVAVDAKGNLIPNA